MHAKKQMVLLLAHLHFLLEWFIKARKQINGSYDRKRQRKYSEINTKQDNVGHYADRVKEVANTFRFESKSRWEYSITIDYS